MILFKGIKIPSSNDRWSFGFLHTRMLLVKIIHGFILFSSWKGRESNSNNIWFSLIEVKMSILSIKNVKFVFLCWYIIASDLWQYCIYVNFILFVHFINLIYWKMKIFTLFSFINILLVSFRITIVKFHGQISWN